MNPKILYKFSGVISVIAGIAAALCVIDPYLMFYGLMLSVTGFIFSGINIFINAKCGFSEGKYSSGFVGMVFSSVPVIYLMYIIFSSR